MYLIGGWNESRMVRAENPGFFFEQSLNTFLVDVNANGDIDSRKDIVDQVDLLVLIHGSEEKIVLNNESLKTELKQLSYGEVLLWALQKRSRAWQSIQKNEEVTNNCKMTLNTLFTSPEPHELSVLRWEPNHLLLHPCRLLHGVLGSRVWGHKLPPPCYTIRTDKLCQTESKFWSKNNWNKQRSRQLCYLLKQSYKSKSLSMKNASINPIPFVGFRTNTWPDIRFSSPIRASSRLLFPLPTLPTTPTNWIHVLRKNIRKC